MSPPFHFAPLDVVVFFPAVALVSPATGGGTALRVDVDDSAFAMLAEPGHCGWLRQLGVHTVDVEGPGAGGPVAQEEAVLVVGAAAARAHQRQLAHRFGLPSFLHRDNGFHAPHAIPHQRREAALAQGTVVGNP